MLKCFAHSTGHAAPEFMMDSMHTISDKEKGILSKMYVDITKYYEQELT